MPFVDRLLHWARAEPARAAVVAGDRSLTYRELADRAAALQLPAGGMLGIQIEDPVDFALTFTAVVGRGRCAAVLDPSWPPDLRLRVLDALQPAAVLTSTPYAHPTDVSPLADPPADALFYCGFTSGTSGLPKGYVRTAGSWSRSLQRSVDWFGVTPGRRVFAPGPLAASLSLYALAECLYAGATFHALAPGIPAGKGPGMAQTLRARRIEHFVGVPSAIRLALERVEEQLPDLHTVVSGGSRLSAADTGIILRAAPAAGVFEYYGASELSLVTARRVDGTADNGVGRPFPGVEIRIDTDGEDGRHLRAGTIHVRTDMAIEGYLFGDDGCAFQRNGDWVTVQDRGWIDDGGALHLTGRHGDMVVVAGTNVYPAEVEVALAHAGYPAAVVLGVAEARRGCALTAVIEAPTDAAIDGNRLRLRLKELLPPVKVPHSIFRTGRLPMTAAGKPDRARLTAAVLAGDGVLERIL